MGNLANRFRPAAPTEVKPAAPKSAPKVDASPRITDKRGRGRPPSQKETITIRISADVLAYFRASGRGWQARLDATLRKALSLTDP